MALHFDHSAGSWAGAGLGLYDNDETRLRVYSALKTLHQCVMIGDEEKFGRGRNFFQYLLDKRCIKMKKEGVAGCRYLGTRGQHDTEYACQFLMVHRVHRVNNKNNFKHNDGKDNNMNYTTTISTSTKTTTWQATTTCPKEEWNFRMLSFQLVPFCPSLQIAKVKVLCERMWSICSMLSFSVTNGSRSYQKYIVKTLPPTWPLFLSVSWGIWWKVRIQRV